MGNIWRNSCKHDVTDLNNLLLRGYIMSEFYVRIHATLLCANVKSTMYGNLEWIASFNTFSIQ